MMQAGFAVQVTLCTKGVPHGKVADITLDFTEGPLRGYCLAGFVVWENIPQHLTVTFPMRPYGVHNQTRKQELLRCESGPDLLRGRIIQAFLDWRVLHNHHASK